MVPKFLSVVGFGRFQGENAVSGSISCLLTPCIRTPSSNDGNKYRRLIVVANGNQGSFNA